MTNKLLCCIDPKHGYPYRINIKFLLARITELSIGTVILGLGYQLLMMWFLKDPAKITDMN